VPVRQTEFCERVVILSWDPVSRTLMPEVAGQAADLSLIAGEHPVTFVAVTR
jgi:hypothetical protein